MARKCVCVCVCVCVGGGGGVGGRRSGHALCLGCSSEFPKLLKLLIPLASFTGNSMVNCFLWWLVDRAETWRKNKLVAHYAGSVICGVCLTVPPMT